MSSADEARLVGIVGSVLVLLVLSVFARAVSKRFGLPDAVMLVVVGAVAGVVADRVDVLAPIGEMVVTPAIVFYVLLPTLVFHSAYGMDVRALRENLGPSLILAIPGLILSTAIIGGIMYWSVPIFGVSLSWPEALLLGSILSATEPVAVLSMFTRVGAPKRLSILVEGESLFNDATAIALSRVLLGVMATGVVGSAFWYGVTQLLFVFAGGLLVGWALALVAGMVVGAVNGDALVEITITTILAYLSFYLGEQTFQVSGVMAVVAAGLVIGGWGRAKISPSVSDYLSDYWDYFAGVANWLIFILVGLTVDLGALVDSLPILAWIVVAMFLSRALSIYTLLPLANRLTGGEPVDRGYQTVILWGGVRGGVALAIALALPETVASRELIISLTTGAVLVSLVVQMFTIERVVRHFRLDLPPVSDRLARLEAQIAARKRALDEIPELQAGGLFSRTVAAEMERRTRAGLEREKEALDKLRAESLDREEERRLLYLRCFAAERHQYYRMLSLGHLSERAYRNLCHSLDLQIEGVRHEGKIPEFTLHPPAGERFETVLYRVLERVPGIRSYVERLRATRAARDYEVAWARYRGDERALSDLSRLAETIGARDEVVEELRAYYSYWYEQARTRLDQTAELFPEFVATAQRRLADRLALQAGEDEIRERVLQGTIPEGVAKGMLSDMREELATLRASKPDKLLVGPEELLKKVPFFRDLPLDEFRTVTERLRLRTAPTGDRIVTQGRPGSALYLIARGVVRVTREEEGVVHDVATLMAGDFFGEMAFLHGGPRTATCRAVTPCALYELRRDDLDVVCDVCPEMKQALEEADRVRRDELAALGSAIVDPV
ncbi:MAG: cation:proton antiporter [Longimicrobiales bacterium]|nr:cation:proton antiporter [Longimicrobiales bacterium]